jgi:hypothetical protein
MSELTGLALAVNQDHGRRLEIVLTTFEGGTASVWHGQEPGLDFSSLGKPDGGAFSSAGPALACNQDGRLEAVVVGQDLAPWHAWQRSPGRDWSPWQSFKQPGGKGVISRPLGASAPGPTPVLARNQDKRLEVFVVREDFTVWHRWQKTPNGDWSDWASLKQPGDGTVGPLAVGANADGRLELAATDSNGAVWHIWQKEPNKDWSQWKSLKEPGGHPAPPGVKLAKNKDGRLELFTVAGDGAVWHKWQIEPNKDWSDWSSLGSQGKLGFAEIAVGPNAQQCLVLFAIEQDSPTGLWQREQTSPNNGWSAWLPREEQLPLPLEEGFPDPGPLGMPAMIVNADGQLELFLGVAGTDMLYRLACLGPTGGDQWTSAVLPLP